LRTPKNLGDFRRIDYSVSTAGLLAESEKCNSARHKAGDLQDIESEQAHAGIADAGRSRRRGGSVAPLPGKVPG